MTQTLDPTCAPAPPVTPPAAAPTDLRRLNWTLLVPRSTGRVLVLAPADPGAARDLAAVGTGSTTVVAPGPDRLPRALAAGPYDGIAVPDPRAWTGGQRDQLLADLAAALAPGGWLLVGQSRLPGSGTPSERSLRRLRRSHGLRTTSQTLALPTLGQPAFLVPARQPGALRHFFDAVFFPYTSRSSALLGRLEQRVLAAGSAVASRIPTILAARLAPACYVVLEKP